MKPGGGRIKGANFENYCGNLLTGWYGGQFKRVPKSGGWDKSVITGDIFRVAQDGGVDPNFPLSVECKNHVDWEIEEVLRGVGKIYKWWKQCTDDCPKRKQPFLMFTRNFKQIYVMYRLGLIHQHLILNDLNRPIIHLPIARIQLWTDFTLTYLPKVPKKDIVELHF